ncbi:MAG TPA: hypothetical protein PKW33_08355 [Anaerolineaceae bacterium]|nr:hypothetical protein [Anaerolineaceae bacterium]HPN51585.1 hypothetical protein [Anaerolineaceae bacterium]
MKRLALITTLFIVLAAVISPAQANIAPAAAAASRPAPAVHFIPNRGQFAPEVLYQTWGGSQQLWITADALWIRDGRSLDTTYRMRFSEIADLQPVPAGQTGTRFSYFVGEEMRWASSVPGYAGLSIGQGRARISAAEDGFKITGETGDVSLARLESSGLMVEMGQRRLDDGAALADLLPALPIEGDAQNAVNRPRALTASTLLGSVATDTGRGIAVTATGTVYVSGNTGDISTFPPSKWGGNGGGQDVVVAQLNADLSSMTAAVFWGGSADDLGYDIAVDDLGVYVTGQTYSTNTTFVGWIPGYTQNQGGSDLFVARFDPELNILRKSVLFGGTGNEDARAMVVASHTVYLAANTASPDILTSDEAFDRVFNGTTEPMLIAIHIPSGTGLSSLVYSSFVGGTESTTTNEVARAVALSSDGQVAISGSTDAADFPTTAGAFDTTLNGAQDVFFTRLDITKTGAEALTYSTYIGGAGVERTQGMVFSEGSYYLAGYTYSDNFPVSAGAYDVTRGTEQEGFALKLTPGSGLNYATFLGGNSWENVYSLAVIHQKAYVVGSTNSDDFLGPTVGGQDVFMVGLNPAGSSLLYRVLLGGGAEDYPKQIVAVSDSQFYLAGTTTSANFPTSANAFQPLSNGDSDLFVSILSSTVFLPFVTK